AAVAALLGGSRPGRERLPGGIDESDRLYPQPRPRMAQRLIALGLLFAASTSQAALAQPLNDPTRPPSATSPESGEPVPSRLQSVLLSPTRKIAVIDGRAVRLGERVGDAT